MTLLSTMVLFLFHAYQQSDTYFNQSVEMVYTLDADVRGQLLQLVADTERGSDVDTQVTERLGRLRQRIIQESKLANGHWSARGPSQEVRLLAGVLSIDASRRFANMDAQGGAESLAAGYRIAFRCGEHLEGVPGGLGMEVLQSLSPTIRKDPLRELERAARHLSAIVSRLNSGFANEGPEGLVRFVSGSSYEGIPLTLNDHMGSLNQDTVNRCSGVINQIAGCLKEDSLEKSLSAMRGVIKDVEHTPEGQICKSQMIFFEGTARSLFGARDLIAKRVAALEPIASGANQGIVNGAWMYIVAARRLQSLPPADLTTIISERRGDAQATGTQTLNESRIAIDKAVSECELAVAAQVCDFKLFQRSDALVAADYVPGIEAVFDLVRASVLT